MDRRSFIKKAGVGGAGAAAATALAAPAIAQSNPKITWRLTSSFPKSLDTIYGGAEVFAKMLSEATDGNFTIQVFAAGELVPGLQAADAVDGRHGRGLPHGVLLLLGQGPDVGARRGRAVRAQCPRHERLAVPWRRHRPDERVLRHAGPCRLPGRQYRRADGRLVPQGDQHGRRPARVSRCASAASPARWSRSSASCRSRSPAATSTRRSKRAPSTRPNGSAPMTTRSSASTRSRPTTTIPAGGRAARPSTCMFNKAKFDELPASYKSLVRTAAQAADADMLQKYDFLNPPAIKQLVADGAQLRPFSPEILAACFDAANEVYAEIEATNPAFKKIWDSIKGFRKEHYPVGAGGRIQLRHLHDDPAAQRQALSRDLAIFSRFQAPALRRAGAFLLIDPALNGRTAARSGLSNRSVH